MSNSRIIYSVEFNAEELTLVDYNIELSKFMYALSDEALNALGVSDKMGIMVSSRPMIGADDTLLRQGKEA